MQDEQATDKRGENAKAGVDYAKMLGFKQAMIEVAKRTRGLPEKRGVFISTGVNLHAVGYQYRGNQGHRWVATKEGLGNKAWIAMLLNLLGLEDPTGQHHFGGIGVDAFLMGANDNAAHGGWPVVLTDEVSCGLDDFFESPAGLALPASFERACVMVGCAMGQGESPSYKYLMKAEPPVIYAPSLSVCVIGIAHNYISGENVRPGDVLIGVPSSGLHANGVSPTIRRVMQLPDGFLTKLNGRTVGEEALIPTRSYIGLVGALLDQEINIHAILPVTGDGIGKLAADDRFHYTVDQWLPDDKIPPLFRFMREVVGMPKKDIAETYNNGMGYIFIVPPSEARKVLDVGAKTRIDGEEGYYDPMIIGRVEEGQAGTHFVPWDLYLQPPGKE